MREPEPILREMPETTVHASPMTGLLNAVTQPWGLRVWPRVYGVTLAMAVFLCLIGAVGSASLPLPLRFAYWCVTLLGGTVATQAVSAVIDRFRLEPLSQAIALFVASTPVIIVVVWFLTRVMFGEIPNPADIPAFAPPVTVITAALSILHYLLDHHPRQTHAHAGVTPVTALRSRLPVKYREADIYALSAEDHYLRVHTSAGETLILMRLYDAIRELDGIEGSQTHRSWWVAKGAIKEVVRSNGKVSLTIAGRTNVPVSRSYAKILKAEGWLNLSSRPRP